jgi:hypothetical protein
MPSLTLLKLAAIGGLVGGTILTFLAILYKTKYETNALIKKSQTSTQLDAHNADHWTSIPGPKNI